MSPISSRTVRRRALALAVGVAAAPGASVTASAATMTSVDQVLSGASMTVNGVDGTSATADAVTVHVTLDGTPTVLSSVERGIAYPFAQGASVPVSVTARDMSVVNNRAIGWVVSHAASGQHQADVSALAVWVLSAQASPAAPTTDATVNAAVAALVAQARASSPAPLALSAAAPAAGATTAIVSLEGRRGAVVDLTVPAADGTLSASSVTLDASGKGIVTLTRVRTGNATVSARTNIDDALYDVVAADGSARPATVTVLPGTVTGAVTVTFGAANVLNVPTDPAVRIIPITPEAPAVDAPAEAGPPVTVAQGAAARLAIATSGPARATSGTVVRYVTTVRNRGTAVARKVAIVQRIPAGMMVKSAPGGQVAARSVRWSVLTLAPGASHRVVLTLRVAPRRAAARATSVAVASATGVRAARATKATVLAVGGVRSTR